MEKRNITFWPLLQFAIVLATGRKGNGKGSIKILATILKQIFKKQDLFYEIKTF